MALKHIRPQIITNKQTILSNVLITGESNFDEKNVEEVFNLCSTEQSCIHIGITCYKIGTLIRIYYFALKFVGQMRRKFEKKLTFKVR